MSFGRFRAKGNKYGRKKVMFEGVKFDSKLELAIYLKLKTDPEIKSIELQDKVYLTEAKILCKIDFKITLNCGEVRWIEAKGLPTPVWNIKKRLWQKFGPGPLEIWTGSHVKCHLDKVIEP